MERHSEKEKSSRKSREEREKDRGRESVKDSKVKDSKDRDHKHRTRDEKHHRSRDIEEDHHSDKHRSLKVRDSDSHRSREYSHDRDSKRERYDREGSRDRVYDHEEKRERLERDSSKDRGYGEDSVDRRHSSHSHKRKERGGSEDRLDGGEKRIKGSVGPKEERKERGSYEDKVADDRDLNGVNRKEKREKAKLQERLNDREAKDMKASSTEERREKRKFGDRLEEDKSVVEEGKHDNSVHKSMKKGAGDERVANFHDSKTSIGSGSVENGSALQPLKMASRIASEPSKAPHEPPITKVSSVTTINENKGVSITKFHEVPGKSSTDGTTSAAGKSANLSLDALAKAKKALQMQKELSEKLKKIPQLNKGASSSSDTSSQVGLNEGPKAPSSSKGILPGPPVPSASPTTPVSLGSPPGAPNLPSASAAVPVQPPAGTGIPGLPGLTNIPNIEAVRRAQELAARMGFRQDPEFAPLINMFPGQIPIDVSIQPKPAKVPVLRLDALGREIDEHGNVIDKPKVNSLSTLKVNINKQKKDAFQIEKPELDVDPNLNPHFDARMGINKTKLLRPKRMSFQFVEEGKWSKEAEIIKLKSQFGEAQAKELKTKQAQLAKAKAEPDINPNLIEVSERVITKEKPKDPIPDIEWWDASFLPSGTYGDITNSNISADKMKMEKITIYIEHPRPIEPPAEPAPPPPQPLKLTKKEQKKLRTQRRLAKEKDRQEMIRQGLIEPPKPKVKMSNLMKVLGAEATQDPTRLEMEIRSAAAEREQAHVDRNIARKLTPAERKEKKERKLFDDPTAVETIVSVYKINDLSHPQTRFKVDVNAQENRLTGCVVISDGISVVVVEGGSKSIKRYGKLMLRRINWGAAVENEDENEDENEEKRGNKCVLVWQGSVAKPSFNRFLVHQCRTEAAARKIFIDAGVPHYWDLAVNFSDDQI